jgi:hypothetical protein
LQIEEAVKWIVLRQHLRNLLINTSNKGWSRAF